MSEAGERKPRAGRRAAVLGGGGRAANWAGQGGGLFAAIFARLSAAFHAEADAARLTPWLAVCFGAGVLLYFAAPAEPSLIAPLVLLAVFAGAAWASRERPFGFAVSLVLTAMAAGFAAGCVRGALVAHPMLTRATGTVTLQGFVETRDTTERSERAVLLLTGRVGRGSAQVPDRVRVAFRRGVAPEAGSHVEVRAQLRPPTGPVRPGGFDFARGIYFQGIGAGGFVLGRAMPVTASREVPWSIRVGAAIESMRRTLTNRIQSLVPGEAGAIAAALVTGVRDSIPPETNEAMRVSGLYHMLSISGLHMALIAGAIFGLIRGGLALIPSLALRRPIKKWAAAVALAGVSFYLVLSGAEVATQRSFIMIAIVLGGVLVDRPAITVRTLSAAAFGVLLLQPEALLNPSFQMSFAATLALVALYERYSSMIAAPPVPGGNALSHFSERALRWIMLGAAASLFAGLATAPYVAFHFHRVAPYSLLANLMAMPLISFVVMPIGLISVLLLPFGYDAYGWKVMGVGIEGIVKIAQWVAALPGADGRFAAFGAGALLLATSGILLLALPATRIRFAGLPCLAGAFLLAIAAPRPDVLVDGEAQVVAVRAPDGRLAMLDASRGRFIAENWLAADGDRRKVSAGLASGFVCDERGCTARLGDGTIIAVPRVREAFIDDCREAGLIVTRLEAPEGCMAPIIDRRTLQTTGAIALRRVDGRWVAEVARSPFADRPWIGRVVSADANALSRLDGGAAVRARAPATTSGEDEDAAWDLSGEVDQ